MDTPIWKLLIFLFLFFEWQQIFLEAHTIKYTLSYTKITLPFCCFRLVFTTCHYDKLNWCLLVSKFGRQLTFKDNISFIGLAQWKKNEFGQTRMPYFDIKAGYNLIVNRIKIQNVWWIILIGLLNPHITLFRNL